MSKDRRFPPVKLGKLGDLLGNPGSTLIRREDAAAEVKRQAEEEEMKRAGSQPASSAQETTPKTKYKLTQAAIDRLNTPRPGEEKKIPTPPKVPQPAPKPVEVKRTIIQPARDPKPKIAPKPVHNDLAKSRAAAADQVRALVGSSTPSIEERPTLISHGSKVRIDRAVAAGAAILRDRPEPDEEGYIIGFDFGTSSLKVAYCQPYGADDSVAVISVPDELRSAGHPGLWQSVIWYHPENEKFSIYPVKGAIALDGFKTGLIAGNGGKPMPQASQVTRAEAATAFLALHFAYMVGAYALEQPLHPVGADHFVLINVGIPVAVCDDKKALGEFSRLVSAAYTLAADVAELSLEAVKHELARSTTTLPCFIQLVPELTAAIAGYAADPMVQHGAHILIDVGASTLDIVAFNLQADQRASVFTAGVDLFGAGALQVARAAGIEDQVFTFACDYLFEDVYGRARADNRAPSLFKPGRRRMPVQLVITGGGCDTDVHNRYINLLPTENVLGAIPLKRPTPPSEILREKGDKSRLLLAYGLTRDVNELHELRLPSEIDDIPPLPVQTIAMVDKDMT